jgi:hypothetical protein
MHGVVTISSSADWPLSVAKAPGAGYPLPRNESFVSAMDVVQHFSCMT